MKRGIVIIVGLFIMLLSVEAQNVALDLDGSDDYVQTTYGGISGTSPRTVEAWIKTSANANPSTGGRQHIITDWGAMTTGARFTFNVLWSNAIRIEVGGSGLSGTISVNDGNWHHVAVVYDPSASNKYRLLVDGSIDTSGNITTAQNTASSVDLRIGMRVDGSNNFDGSIDNVKVYNYARTDSAIAADRFEELCSTPSGLVAYFKLNDGTAGVNNAGKNTAANYIGSGNGSLINFALTGSSSNWVSGPSLNGGDSYATIDTVECYTYTGPAGGNPYSLSGTYTQTISNAVGCDSIITINLTIGRNFEVIRPVSCDTFISPKGRIITNSGISRDTFFNANRFGCDSILLIDATINKTKHSFDTMSFCDSVIVNSMTFYTTTDIDLFATASNNCDSIHHLRLLVNNSSQNIINAEVCDAYQSPRGNIYTQTGTYYDTLYSSNWQSCDSIIQTNLIVNQSFDTLIQQSSCDSFVSEGGVNYKNSGLYSESYTSAASCDSIVRYNLSINQSKVQELNLESCDSALVNNVWYFNSTEFDIDEVTVAGCDSIVQVKLNITTIDATIEALGDTLIAVSGADSYNWINCSTNQPISGADKDTFITGLSGDYKVFITQDNCTKESECINVPKTASTGNVEFLDLINIYPNPNKGDFYLEMPAGLYASFFAIYNAAGQEVLRQELNDQTVVYISTVLSKGVYFLKIETEKGAFTKRLQVH